MVSESTATWAMTATTADLLWHFHNCQANLRMLQGALKRDDPPPSNVSGLEQAIYGERACVRAIVAELRRRGHAVQWEE